jgi:hypothetical protein
MQVGAHAERRSASERVRQRERSDKENADDIAGSA